MALWICTGCTTRFSVGAARCPQCGHTEHVEEGAAEMAKITVHGGPSNAAADAEEGGEESSPGTSSSTPSEKPQNSAEPSDKPARSRARGTGNRSNRGQTEADATAGSTDTAGPKTAGPDSK